MAYTSARVTSNQAKIPPINLAGVTILLEIKKLGYANVSQ